MSAFVATICILGLVGCAILAGLEGRAVDRAVAEKYGLPLKRKAPLSEKLGVGISVAFIIFLVGLYLA